MSPQRDPEEGSPPDEVASVEVGAEIELREKDSRFLARALPADDEGATRLFVERARREYPDATHHCWAARIGVPPAFSERSDDAGEPSGTAGLPILTVLKGAELHSVLVVVTRYFGGTKLGKGGLVRAYGGAARLALAAAPRRVIWRRRSLIVHCRYDDLGAVEGVIVRGGKTILAVDRRYDPDPCLSLEVRASVAETLVAEIADATAGRAKIDPREEDGATAHQ